MDRSISTHEVFQAENTAVITGASSGIGRCAALQCALEGMHVWMVDIDEVELTYAKNKIKSLVEGAYADQKIQGIVADVSDEENMKFVAETVIAHKSTKSVHFLMNNAARSIGGSAVHTSMKDFRKMMETNLYGSIHTCQHLIPFMKEKNEPGIIVNTGSKQGITSPPGNLTYNVTKAALKTWTEGLEHELMMDRFYKDGKLKAALLVPGWTNTSIKVKELRDRSALSKAKKPPNMKKLNYEAIKSMTTHEDNPADGAWMPKEVYDYMMRKLDEGSFYIICPDNEVDTHMDNIRMTWAMQDITEDRPPLSRWHPEWKGEFADYLNSQEH